MDQINQATQNPAREHRSTRTHATQMDQRAIIKTEGIVNDEEQEGESAGVWPMTNDGLHDHPFDKSSVQQQTSTAAKLKHPLQIQGERNYASPQQEALAAKIAEQQGQLLELYERQNNGTMTEYDAIELDRVSKELKTMKAQLKRKQQNQATQARARERKRKLFDSLDPDTRVKVFGRKDLKIGRPSLCDNEELKKAILEITSQAAINDGRKSDTIRTAISLNQITAELQKRGFNLKRSAVYTRLLPRKASTHEGKRHNNIVPVKLVGTPTNRGSQPNTSTNSQVKKTTGTVSGQSAPQPTPSGIIDYPQGQVSVSHSGGGHIDNSEQHIATAFIDQSGTTVYHAPHDILKRQPTTIQLEAPTIWSTQNVGDIQTSVEGVGETVTIFTTGDVTDNQDEHQSRIEPSHVSLSEVPVNDGLSSSRGESEESNPNVLYSTPKQDALVARIAYLQDQETSYLLTGLTPGMLSEKDARDLQRISKELQTLKAQLRKKQGDQKRQAKAREKKKKLLEQLDEETKLKVFGKLDVGQKKIRRSKDETSSPTKKEKSETEIVHAKSPSRGSRRLAGRKKKRMKGKVPVPAYLYSTFDKETKAYFTPKEEPQSPTANTVDFYHDDLFDGVEKGNIKDDSTLNNSFLEPETDMHVLDGLDNTQPSEELIKTIIRVALPGDTSKQKLQVVPNVANLEELAAALHKENLQLHTTGSDVYRLLPNKGLSDVGKRSLKSAATTNEGLTTTLSKHPDINFINAITNHLEELASILGPTEVSFHSQNASYRVPIGLALSNSEQSPLLMHVEEVNDDEEEEHVSPPAHKLILSVTGDMQIKENCFTTTTHSASAVSNVGTNYVSIRSAQSQPPVALQRLRDMKLIRQLQEFQLSVNTEEGLPKPVMIMTIKGSPDNNPHYSKTILCAIDYFCTFDLDALFIARNLTGETQTNGGIKERIVPIAKDLAKVILPYEHFGQHYDGNNDTIDEELEKMNYEKAGKVLSEMLSDIEIDGFPTVAEYIVSEEDTTEDDFGELINKDEEWRCRHVRESQYLLQIRKCDDVNCCSAKRSSLFRVLPDGFLPPPVPIKQTKHGLSYSDQVVLSSLVNGEQNIISSQYLSLFQNLAMGKAMLPAIAFENFPQEIPYDFSCPSMKTRLKHNSENANKGSFDLNIIPDKILVKKGGEYLCRVKTKLNSYEYDWYRHEEIDASVLDIDEVPEAVVKSGIKVYTEEQRRSMWEDR